MPSSARAARYRIPDTGEPDRICVAGDIHGDMAALEGALLSSGVATPVTNASSDPNRPASKWKWVAPAGTAMVFVGDIVDRWRPGQQQTQKVILQLERGANTPQSKPTKLRVEGKGCSFRVRSAQPSKYTHNGLLVELDREAEDPVLENGAKGTLFWDRANAYGVSLKVNARVVRSWLPLSLGEYEGEEKQILEIINDLQRQAKAHGSRVVKVIGNHEAWTVMGDYSYATPAGREAWPGGKERAKEVARLYATGGDTHAIVRLGRWVFAHAGLTTRWLESMRRAIRKIVRMGDVPEMVSDPLSPRQSAQDEDDEDDDDDDDLPQGKDPMETNPGFVFEVANGFARTLLESAARDGADGATAFLSTPKVMPLTEAMINNKESVWLTRSLGSSEGVVNPRFVEDLFRTVGMDVKHDRLVCGHNVQFPRRKAANPRMLHERPHQTSRAAREAGVEVEAFEAPMGKRKTPHGINFALPQEGGGGALGFVDIGASRAFNMGEESCYDDVLEARAYQTLCWDRASDRTQVMRIKPEMAGRAICSVHPTLRGAARDAARRKKSIYQRGRNTDDFRDSDDEDDQ